MRKPKKRFYRRKWVAWTSSVLLVLLLGGYFSWNYAMNYLLGSMISQSLMSEYGDLETLDDDRIPGAKDTDKEIPQNMDNQDEQGKETRPEGISNEPGNSQVQPEDSTNSNSIIGGENKTPPVPATPSSSSNSGGGSSGVSSQGGGNSGAGAGVDSSNSPNANTGGSGGTGYDPSITEEIAKQVQESITLKEKTKVTSVLMKRLSASDISTLMKLASGGVSSQEKKQAKNIMIEKLTVKEYNELIDIAHKYGLSQGKKIAE